jgi:uncharacterized Tic20 family protein
MVNATTTTNVKSKVNSKVPEDRSLMVLTHVLGIFAGFWSGLIILLTTHDEEVKKHARVNLNWIFSAMIYNFACLLLFFISIPLMLIVVGFVTIFLAILGFITVGVLNLVFSIMAAVKANNGELWKYPLSIPFFKVE